jgi:hypothetical protein
MSIKMTLQYNSDLIDKAIREHIERNLGITNSVQIVYTHKRKTRSVSAEVHVLNDFDLEGIASIAQAPEPILLDKPATVAKKSKKIEIEPPLELAEILPKEKVTTPAPVITAAVQEPVKAFDKVEVEVAPKAVEEITAEAESLFGNDDDNFSQGFAEPAQEAIEESLVNDPDDIGGFAEDSDADASEMSEEDLDSLFD